MTGATDASSLLEAAASEFNLWVSLYKVVQNKGAPGVDGVSVETVLAQSKELLPRLRRQLLDGSYRPGDIRRVWIPKPGGGERGLGIPNVIDRWVQQAVLQVLEPIFEPTFHDSSHGFRRGRGAQTAIAQARKHLAGGHTTIVDIDLAKFFDRVNHQRLLARLAQRVKDKRVLATHWADAQSQSGAAGGNARERRKRARRKAGRSRRCCRTLCWTNWIGS